jgi:peroxiredoxin
MILATIVLLAFASRVCASGLKRSDEAAKPEFTLQDMDGKTVSLKAFKGRTVLVHFFATWCEPCREELPALTRFLSRSAPSVSVVATAVADADQRVTQFFERTPVNFPVLLDRNRAVAKSWNVSTLPSTYVLDARMKALLRVDADFQWDTVDMDPATGNLITNKIGAANTTSDSSDMKQRDRDHGPR